MKESQVINKYLNKCRNCDLELVGIGSDKLCYGAGKDKVLLRYRQKIVEKGTFKEMITVKHLTLAEIGNKLFSAIPQMVSCCLTENGHYYELQERARGRCLAYYSEEETMLKVFGVEYCKLPYESLSADQKRELAEKVYVYNRFMQKQLKDSANTVHLLHFLQDYRALCNMGHQIDNHSENIFFDPKVGFTFIDVNHQVYEYNQKLNDEEIFREVLAVFNCFYKYTPLMTREQTLAIERDVKNLKLKLLELAERAGYKLSPAFIKRAKVQLTASQRKKSESCQGEE